MEQMFFSVLNMSLTASFAILLVLIVRAFLRKTPKLFSYCLWSVVLFRLICPFSFESVISLIPVKSEAISKEIFIAQAPNISVANPLLDSAINVPNIVSPVGMSAMQIVIVVAIVTWILGIAIMLAYSIITIMKLKYRLKTAIHLKENIYESEAIMSPFVLGVFKPKIYLPMTWEDNSPKDYILLHEQTHITRRDYLVKPIAFLALSLHWFNPLVWISFRLMSRDMEMSCDESVLKAMGRDVKCEYSASLLQLASETNWLGGGPLAFGESDTTTRIKNILNFKKRAFWVVIVATIVVIAVVIGLIANPKANPVTPEGAREPYSEEIFVDTLLESNSLENGVLKFTIPTVIPEGFTLFIQASGRIPMGNDFMSIHAFEDETASGDWVGGKTYQEKLNDSGTSNGYEINLTVELKSKTDENTTYGDTIRFSPPLYENTQGSQKVKTCIHEIWMHQFSRPMVKQIGNDKFYEWVRMPTDDYCGSTIFEMMDNFNLDYDKFVAISNEDPIYSKLQNFRKELTDFTVGKSDRLASTKYIVELVMAKGVYNSGSILIPGGGTYSNNYTGEYELQTKKDGNIVDRFPLREPTILGSNFDLFDILIDDYNDDGNSDFTIGSWGSSNGLVYVLFSVDNKGKISMLERDSEAPTYYVASHDFSIRFDKINPTTFSYEWYDNGGIAEMISETFTWKENKFVNLKNRDR